jgi:hypothetical protein
MHPLKSLLVVIALTLITLSPALSESGPRDLVQAVGTPDVNPERDTVGYLRASGEVDETGSLSGTPRGAIVPVGASTGDAEKDTLGYLRPDPAR